MTAWDAWAIVSKCSTGWKIYRDEHGQIDLFKSRDDARQWIGMTCELKCQALHPRAVKVRVELPKKRRKP